MLRARTTREPMRIHGGRLAMHTTAEFLSADPDCLRDAVSSALSSLPESKRSIVRKRLLNDLTSAGLKIRQTLLMLGVSAKTADELTAPEIAALIRYVRLTEPKAMMAAAATLSELITVTEPSQSVRAA